MAEQEFFLKVAVPTPLRQEFDYLPPPGLDPASLRPGIRLQVPFGAKTVTALLMAVVTATALPRDKLRPAGKVLDSEPVITGCILELCRWAADYYHHPLGEVLVSALPVLLRRGGRCARQQTRSLELTGLGQDTDLRAFARAPRQKAILDLLVQRGEPMEEAELSRDKIGVSALRILLEKQLVQWRTNYLVPQPWAAMANPVNSASVQLNAEQELVLSQITVAQDGGECCYLLEGVTGSGKTEIYLQVIAACLRAGRQALVLVPEIGLTPQTVNRFRERFNVPIEVLHSGLNDRERLEAWQNAGSGSSAVVIGTRSAIFTPLLHPGVIVVDEEHDHSFKQQDGFRYSARDLAVMRGHMERIPVILGSATPSLESLQNAKNGRYRWLQLTKRAGGAAQPQYRIVDIRNQPLDEGFSMPLIGLMGEHLIAGNQVMVFINRRGFAPTLLCHECGWMAECRRCDARLTLHTHSESLQCHHCGTSQAIYSACPQCGAARLARLGLGTQRSETALQRLFPDQRIFRIDRDTMGRKNAMAVMVEEIGRGKPCILVGTQMLAKGHHFPHLTLVAIVDADAGFFSSDFRAVERMGQLLIQVTGRTGRSDKAGQAVIQTHFSDHPLLMALTRKGYPAFAETLLADRQATGLPPYSHMALIRAEAKQDLLPMRFLQEVRELHESLVSELALPEVAILGPIPSAMERKAGRFRAQLMLQTAHRNRLQKLLSSAIPKVADLNLARRVRWSVDVDPLDTI